MITLPVLDKGHVVLIDMLPSLHDAYPGTSRRMFPTPDQAIVQAARASTFKTGPINELTGLKGEAADKKLLKYLWDHGHLSPFEHVVFKFHIKAPLLVARQWMRHRTQSINEMSFRYQEAEDEFYLPTTWRAQAIQNKQASDDTILGYKLAMSIELAEHINRSMQLYRQALDLGVAREQARLFLPAFALYTEWYTTINLRNLLDFIRQRDHIDAQLEIRLYAQALKQIVTETCPWTAAIAFA